MQQRLNIAIDGPAGAGKSTVARRVAERLHIRYLDTGAMYRAMALYAMRCGVPVQDEAAVERVLRDADIRVRYTEDGQRVLLSGEDVTDGLRTPELSMAASDVSAHRAVRVKLTELQREVARENDVVMDGRDIGTNVLPDAALKVFLTADPRERARRRYEELRQKGMPDTLEEVLAALTARDEQDTRREANPLRQAEDAVLLDTTHMTIQEAVDAIVRLARRA